MTESIITKSYLVYAVQLRGDWRKWYTCEAHHPVIWVMPGRYEDSTKTMRTKNMGRDWDLCGKCRTW